MLGKAYLLALRNRYMHSAPGAAVVCHCRNNDVALFIKPFVDAGRLRLKLLPQSVNSIIEGIEPAAVARLVVFVSCEDQLLELP
jgi:hypothetical protein